MNRLLYVSLLSALTIFGFIMYQQRDLGHVSFSFAGITFETNIIVFTAGILCAAFAVMLIMKTWQLIKNAFIYLFGRREARLQEKARSSLTQGLIEYAEGRFEQAEKILMQQVKYSDNRLLVYLSAARAAQQLGAHERRDEYLRKAHQEAPDADIAIGLTKAELQLAHQQNEQALATLTHLNTLTENHRYVLTLLASTYRKLHDWENLNELLPALKKHGQLSTEQFLDYEIAVCNGLMKKLTIYNDSRLLINHWKETAHHLKTLPDVIECYARQLIHAGSAGEAENVLRLYLNKNWQETTIILYAELDVMVDNKQLEMAESWLKDHQHNAWLLLALGKMCISRSLWGKARNYLEASISINPVPQSYLRLARLLEEHMDDVAAAQEYYRQGLHLLADDYEDDIIEENKKKIETESPQLQIVKA